MLVQFWSANDFCFGELLLEPFDRIRERLERKVQHFRYRHAIPNKMDKSKSPKELMFGWTVRMHHRSVATCYNMIPEGLQLLTDQSSRKTHIVRGGEVLRDILQVIHPTAKRQFTRSLSENGRSGIHPSATLCLKETWSIKIQLAVRSCP